MTRERIRPRGRLRLRLTIAFMLAAGVSAIALAGGSYLLVRSSRLDDSLDRSLEQARSTFVLAATILDGASDTGSAKALVQALERRPGFDAVVLPKGELQSTSLSLGLEQIPTDLRELVRLGGLAYERVAAGGERQLVVGGRPFGSDTELYLFFQEERIYDDLRSLAIVLIAGAGILVVISGLAGGLIARRVLRPVAQASGAAQSLAEGLLETRLPVERADEFGLWAASFNEMADALEDKIQALSAAEARERRFTADVAHELRTPLTALVNEASLLAEHLDRMPADARRPAELLVQDVGRLRDLVEELMEISRLDAGREAVEREEVALRATIDALLRARGWSARVAVTGDELVLDTDRRRLERIVANLVQNALEHGNGRAEIQIGRTGEGATIAVADHGPGIRPEHLARVFDRFYKADPARAAGGSGLGLAIARENARLLGGDITAESPAEGGARFTVRLGVAERLHGGGGGVARADEDDER